MEMILIRGLPGSGKSTLAKRLMKINTAHFEADMYFVRDGVYTFDGSRIAQAHGWCQRETENALHYKQDVIVSNTFTTLGEMRFYFDLAKEHAIIPLVLTCHNQFGNVHGVPEEALTRMKSRWISDVTPLFESIK